MSRAGERPYVDTRVTDVERADRLAAEASSHWGLGAPIALRRGMNAIYRCGDAVVRVATPTAPAQCSIRLAETLADAGVPVLTAIHDDVVVDGDMTATAWPVVEDVGAPVDWSAVGRAVRRVHDVDVSSLPDGLPTPSPVSFPWWDFASMLDAVGDRLDDRAADGIRIALDRHAGWDTFAETVVCHGDVHPGNVLVTADGPVLIDWDLLCLAPRGWDHAPLMTWSQRWGGAPGIYEAFAEGYGWSGRGDRSAEAFAELRLVAATLMRLAVAADRPEAMPEAERRLALWRGDPDAPVWNPQ